MLAMSQDEGAFGSAVRDARRKARLSQGELAAIVGVRQQTICKIETGETEKSAYRLELSRFIESVEAGIIPDVPREPACPVLALGIRITELGRTHEDSEIRCFELKGDPGAQSIERERTMKLGYLMDALRDQIPFTEARSVAGAMFQAASIEHQLTCLSEHVPDGAAGREARLAAQRIEWLIWSIVRALRPLSEVGPDKLALDLHPGCDPFSLTSPGYERPILPPLAA